MRYNLMNILEFLLIYIVAQAILPVIDCMAEYVSNIIHLRNAKLALELTKIQADINKLSEDKTESSVQAIGFCISSESDEEES